jgi:hypothetical protein
MSRDGRFNLENLTSKIKNTATPVRDIVCSFLPPHGRTILSGETVEFFGDIWDHLKNQRQRQALADALDRGDLSIVSSPSQVLQDAGLLTSKVLRLNDGALSVTDPSWVGESAASESAVPD